MDFLEAVVFQKILKLFLDHRHSLKDRGGVGGRFGGVEAELEIIDDGEESLEQAIVGIADGFLFFTQGTLAEIIEISAGAEGEVFELGGLGFEVHLGDFSFLTRVIRCGVLCVGFVRVIHFLEMAMSVKSSCLDSRPVKARTSSATCRRTAAAPWAAPASKAWARRSTPYATPSAFRASVAPSV